MRDGTRGEQGATWTHPRQQFRLLCARACVPLLRREARLNRRARAVGAVAEKKLASLHRHLRDTLLLRALGDTAVSRPTVPVACAREETVREIGEPRSAVSEHACRERRRVGGRSRGGGGGGWGECLRDTHVSHASRFALNFSRRFVSKVLFPPFPRRKDAHSCCRRGLVHSFLAVGRREVGVGEGRGGRRVNDTRREMDEGLTN